MNKRPFWIRTLPEVAPEIPEDRDLIAGCLISAYPSLTGQLTAFYLALRTGNMAHELHAHDDGEIVILLEGHLDVVLGPDRLPMIPGSFYYNPPHVMHTVQSVGAKPAVFLALRFDLGSIPQPVAEVTTFMHDPSVIQPWADGAGAERNRLVEGHRLACGGHLSVDRVRIAPYSGYPLHTHDHDVLYVLLKGALHGLGHITPAPALMYYPAAAVHGVSSESPESLDMLVFEFHRIAR